MAKCPKCRGTISYLLVEYMNKGIVDIVEVGRGLPMRRELMEKRFLCPLCGEALTDDYREALCILGLKLGL